MLDCFGGCLIISMAATAAAEGLPIEMGSRLEPFVDAYLIESLDGAFLTLQAPWPRETVIEFDRPWEGRYCGYVTVLKAGETFRMYYRGLPQAGKDGSDVEVTCYAESSDGIHWTKPNLDIHEVLGTTQNNAILAQAAPFSHNFCPFLDTRPSVPEDERFKAVAGTGASGLVAFVSADGIHWRKLREEPIVTEGAFDSQNLAFWSEAEGCYCCYFRVFVDGIRRISRSTSPDFHTWSKPVLMEYRAYPPDRKAPIGHLYTNQTGPYFRAPHVYVSIAARFMPGRRVVAAQEAAAFGVENGYSGDCSDAVFLTTRGGSVYDRTFLEGFVRPGLGHSNWTSRTNYPAYGVVQTAPEEMSFYVQRNYGQPTQYLQRFTLRLDGFASVHAPYGGGEMVTKPLAFGGVEGARELVLNYSTSAAGSIWVEIQDESGTPIPGFLLGDSDEIVGDEIERAATWQGNSDVGALAGRPVRLRFVMKDADLFSIRFRAK